MRTAATGLLAVLSKIIQRPPTGYLANSRRPELRSADVQTCIQPPGWDRQLLGSMLETFVLQELRRQASWRPEPLVFYHFRDRYNFEVDIVLEKGHGRVDYLLFVNGQPAGVIEAKPEGTTLVEVEHQSGKYVDGLPEWMKARVYLLPFIYQSTGSETRFTNGYDPDARSRRVFTFHRPETLAEWSRQITAVPLSRQPHEIADYVRLPAASPAIDRLVRSEDGDGGTLAFTGSSTAHSLAIAMLLLGFGLMLLGSEAHLRSKRALETAWRTLR